MGNTINNLGTVIKELTPKMIRNSYIDGFSNTDDASNLLQKHGPKYSTDSSDIENGNTHPGTDIKMNKKTSTVFITWVGKKLEKKKLKDLLILKRDYLYDKFKEY
ncbi:hypothetical protein YYC_00215 [Plasmodium yoelii 17X]|uniref:Uncharacterized protein n=1 Tax=Plasmodium yoelii 17X TaxID=1323249 RepID=V7PXU7_PLAYE|nr:hypothetical protein YYC_00215 [Plasmodium yoelii 17X]